MTSLPFANDESDRGGESVPVFQLARELFAAGGSERVELCLASRVGHARLRLEPALLLEAMERWIQRALRDLQDIAAHLLDALRDCPPVLRLERDGLQNEQVEGSAPKPWRRREAREGRAARGSPARGSRMKVAIPIASRRGRTLSRSTHCGGAPPRTPSQGRDCGFFGAKVDSPAV
jgi:hypothetical protein